jgi:peptidoglycan-N-acetylglucosamine deacetylase
MALRRTVSVAVAGLLVTVASGFGLSEAVHLVKDGRYGSLSPVCRVQTSQKLVALTFDDGPDPAFTPSVLTVLGQSGDKATFFVTGSHADHFPQLVEEELSAGMEIGNHTWSHPHLLHLTTAQATSEVVRTNELLSSRFGISAQLFRAPFGEISVDQLRAVDQLGMRPIHWSLAIDHYVGGLHLAPNDAAARLIRDIRPGDIVLAHDARGAGRAAAMATMRLLLPALGERGFVVTTVGDLLRQGSASLASPRSWFWQAGFSCSRP